MGCMDNELWFTPMNGLVVISVTAFASRFDSCELWACLPWGSETWAIDAA